MKYVNMESKIMWSGLHGLWEVSSYHVHQCVSPQLITTLDRAVKRPVLAPVFFQTINLVWDQVSAKL